MTRVIQKAEYDTIFLPHFQTMALSSSHTTRVWHCLPPTPPEYGTVFLTHHQTMALSSSLHHQSMALSSLPHHQSMALSSSLTTRV
ncbi:hypothetical protein Pmani_016844 [Petrolisthes manimaculis]|uniref:Uncharacterized protein n=1 Tax=Petrolisthes manimaculis TaxID=1843537 RepID=A0AAE1PQS6_9EUCA|nr:hypothetical protein Pmani_016844 [Petrolisthes manimaculis]